MNWANICYNNECDNNNRKENIRRLIDYCRAENASPVDIVVLNNFGLKYLTYTELEYVNNALCSQ